MMPQPLRAAMLGHSKTTDWKRGLFDAEWNHRSNRGQDSHVGAGGKELEHLATDDDHAQRLICRCVY
jgi:hypothetical protein